MSASTAGAAGSQAVLGTRQPGFVLCSYSVGRPDPPVDFKRVFSEWPGSEQRVDRGVALMTWGLPSVDPAIGAVILPGRVNRRHENDLNLIQVTQLLGDPDHEWVREMLPPFAAVRIEPTGQIHAVTDHMGFRQLYLAVRDGWSGISTSALALGALTGSGLDQEGLAVQSLLGWQLHNRTLFKGVEALTAGEGVVLSEGRCTRRLLSVPAHVANDPADTIQSCAALLRQSVASYVDQHPDCVLQLTGGQDSRLLLSAIPEFRRRGLKTMTLGYPGQADVDVASELSKRYHMSHEVRWFDGLEQLPPEDAYALCLRAAERLDCLADPVAFAALAWAESRFEQAPRLSGLGGEVARGFYYLGSGREVSVTASRARQLAAWRMFANESVEPDAVDRGFAEWSRTVAHREVFLALDGSRTDWLRATDHLYLRHRMRRWAGVTDTAVCFDREVVNPMLDRELDLELAAVPLDGRPPPIVYAERSVANRARLTASTAHRAIRKVRQRVMRRRRPPAGAVVLAQKVVEHWQSDARDLERVDRLGLMSREWLEQTLRKDRQPLPSTVAFLVNLASATTATS
jgi:asparagine synthase (glutamine-hydrolysing)